MQQQIKAKTAVLPESQEINIPDVTAVLEKLETRQERTPAEVTRLERLTELKYMLENHDQIFPETKFNLDMWMEGPSICGLQDGTDVRQEHACGTAACALGSAAVYAPFVKQGLSLKKEKRSFHITTSPQYQGAVDFRAGANFFGISEAESDFLFNPSTYFHRAGTSQEVADRVGGLIAQYSK